MKKLNQSRHAAPLLLALALALASSGCVTPVAPVVPAATAPVAASPDPSTLSTTPAMQDASWAVAWWEKRHLAYKEEVKKRNAEGKKIDLVFIGDSITEGWSRAGGDAFKRNYAQYGAMELGFGGDRTENILWRLQHGAVDNMQPKVAVLMFGTNNTGHRREHPDYVAAGIKRNIVELQQRLPNTKILLLAIFPRDEKPDGQLRMINEQINQRIAGFADNKKVFFLNINNSFLQPDGVLSKEIMPDLLHLSPKGYDIWANSMAPTLNQLMK